MKYRKQIAGIYRINGGALEWCKVYVAYIQVRKPFRWVTVKKMVSEDIEYLGLCADELIEKLEEEI